ncbi:unnamed protein product [Calypogeia fissa]
MIVDLFGVTSFPLEVVREESLWSISGGDLGGAVWELIGRSDCGAFWEAIQEERFGCGSGGDSGGAVRERFGRRFGRSGSGAVWEV